MTNSQLDTTNESQDSSPFPAGDHKAHINRSAQRHSKYRGGGQGGRGYRDRGCGIGGRGCGIGGRGGWAGVEGAGRGAIVGRGLEKMEGEIAFFFTRKFIKK